MHKCCVLEKECHCLRKQCEQLKRAEKTTAICFTEEFFNNDDAKVKYYTGIANFHRLMAVFNW